MATALQKKEIDWINPANSTRKPTFEEYRAHMAEAERSGDISFEKFKKDMEAWRKKLI